MRHHIDLRGKFVPLLGSSVARQMTPAKPNIFLRHQLLRFPLGGVILGSDFTLLNNLRAFRHRERNSYATTLDLEIVIERAPDAITAAGHLKDEMQPFLNVPVSEQRQ